MRAVDCPPYSMNRLHVGFEKDIALPKGSFLYINDEIPSHLKAKVFDPLKHSFDPLKDIDRKTARDLAHMAVLSLLAVLPRQSEPAVQSAVRHRLIGNNTPSGASQGALVI
jgi:hypothetical protein